MKENLKVAVLLLLLPLRLLWKRMLGVYVHLCVQASSAAKCPGCGIRLAHDMRWSPENAKLVHVCKRCMAVWCEDAVVAASIWSTKLVAENEPDSDGTTTGNVVHAQREPIVTQEFKPAGRSKPVVVRIGGNA